MTGTYSTWTAIRRLVIRGECRRCHGKLSELYKAGGLLRIGAEGVRGAVTGLKNTVNAVRALGRLPYALRAGTSGLTEIERFLQTGGELRRVRGDADFFTDWADEAYDLGCMAENFEGVPLTATVTVTVLGAADAQGVALATDPRVIAESLKTITLRREGDAWRKVTTVELPEVGLCARTFGVEDVPVEQGDPRTIRMVLTQTYVPVPGRSEEIVLISGASPVLDLAEASHDIFDAVTSTFRFVPAAAS